MKLKLAIVCLALAAFAVPAGAQQRRPVDHRQTAQERPPQEKSTAAQPAEARPDPRDRVAGCHQQARDRKLEGDARKSFMTECSGRKVQTTAPRQKAKSCVEQAKTRKLGGEAHKDFVAKCMNDGA